ncbi:hypothetical protein AeNC1_011028 [Aphanomyces euteiches]|nr:hypothetical protein AeNC1_011028 [Aphanomyces euteiches]
MDRPSTSPRVAAWMRSMKQEQRDWRSFVEYSKTQLEHAIRSSEHHGDPNAFRTAVCFDLLENLGHCVDRYQNLLDRIRTECERAVYVNIPDGPPRPPGNNVHIFMELEPYFKKLHVQRAIKTDLDDDIEQLDRHHAFMLSQLENKERVIERLTLKLEHTVRVQIFRNWRQVTAKKKHARAAVARAMQRWNKRLVSTVFHGWWHLISSEKQSAAKSRLAKLSTEAATCREAQQRLEASIRHLHDEIQRLGRSTDAHKTTQKKLQDVFASLEDEITNTRERQLQTISNEWGRLCLALVDAQIAHLNAMIDAVPWRNYTDATLLLGPRENKTDLLQRLPEDLIVLKWTSFMQQRTSHTNGSRIDLVQNYTSDLKGLHVVANVLQTIEQAISSTSPAMPTTNWSTDTILIRLRAYRCPEYLVEHLREVPCPSDVAFCVLSYLFCEFPCLYPSVCPWQEAQTALEEAKTTWQIVRHGWTELHQPFDPTKLANFTPDATHVGAVVAAKVALQNAVQMVQYACAARAVTMQLWSCVQKRVHAKAMDILLFRARTGVPFQMPNRRAARERALYTQVDIEKLKRILHTDVELDFGKLDGLLATNYEDIQRIFKYYAASSDLGDAESLSLDEFHRFLKDAKLLAKSFGLAMMHTIFNEIHSGEELGPTEFVEAIITVAAKRWTNRALSLSQRVQKSLTEHILVHACRSSSNTFRRDMVACKAILDHFQPAFELIYRRYSDANRLTSHAFFKFVHDYDLFSENIGMTQVKHVLSKIQQDDNVLVDDMELTVAEFIEALGAFALYENPNIFVSVQDRVQTYFTKITKRQ